MLVIDRSDQFIIQDAYYIAHRIILFGCPTCLMWRRKLNNRLRESLVDRLRKVGGL